MNRSKPIRNILAGLICCTVSVAQAEYKDAIHLPSLKMDSAPVSLLLDIVDTGESLVAAGERGHILFSEDRGQTWTQVTVPTRLQLNALSFADANTGWAAGEDELILKTTDGGKEWQLQHEGHTAETKGPILDLLFKNQQEGFAVGVYSKLFRTTDGGATWEDWQSHIDNEDEWHLLAIAATGEQQDTIYIASEAGLMFRSTDSGESFTQLQTDHDGSFHGILARRDSEGMDQLVLVGVGGILYTSLDSGDSWNKIETQTEAGLASAAWLADGSVLIVGADGVVLKLDASLQKLEKHQTEAGLALSRALPLNQNQALMVGFGGIQEFKLQ